MVLWYAIQNGQDGGFKELVDDCIDRADYALAKLKEAGIEAWKHENSITVVFEKPPQEIIEKWSLAVEDGISHMITVKQVSREIIDRFVSELAKSIK